MLRLTKLTCLGLLLAACSGESSSDTGSTATATDGSSTSTSSSSGSTSASSSGETTSGGSTGGSTGAATTTGTSGSTGGGSTSDGSGSTGAANEPPIAEITMPDMDIDSNDLDYTYDDYDDTLQLWYKDVMVAGTGIDPEDGNLTGSSLVWTTDRDDLQDAMLGTGEAATIRLYSNVCEGVKHEVTLTATDSADASGTAVRTISIWTLC